MTKGVLSPWQTPKKETSEEKAERMIEESPEGAPRREITFDGRALSSALVADGTLAKELTRQSIFTDEKKVLAAKVTIRLGPVTLFAKASSFDAKMAQLMAMDRLALAIVDSRNASAKVRKTMEDHDVVIARKA